MCLPSLSHLSSPLHLNVLVCVGRWKRLGSEVLKGGCSKSNERTRQQEAGDRVGLPLPWTSLYLRHYWTVPALAYRPSPFNYSSRVTASQMHTLPHLLVKSKPSRVDKINHPKRCSGHSLPGPAMGHWRKPTFFSPATYPHEENDINCCKNLNLLPNPW